MIHYYTGLDLGVLSFTSPCDWSSSDSLQPCFQVYIRCSFTADIFKEKGINLSTALSLAARKASAWVGFEVTSCMGYLQFPAIALGFLGMMDSNEMQRKQDVPRCNICGGFTITI